MNVEDLFGTDSGVKLLSDLWRGSEFTPVLLGQWQG